MTNQLAFTQFCSGAPRKGTLGLCLALCTLGLGLSASAQDHKATIITFDAPGAQVSQFSGTMAYLITPAGEVGGNYLDANQVIHGFLRSSEGTFTTIDAPGAGSETGSFQGTFPESITPAGAITGYYEDSSNLFHGFLRAKNGTFTVFDVPGAGTGPFQGTFPLNINPAGAIAGQYNDETNVYHGFVRALDGTMTVFDAPGAGTSSGQGTLLASFEGLNSAGAIAGNYTDASGVSHGYVRAPDGSFTTFDVPGAGTGSGQGTYSDGINPSGAIPGPYTDASGVLHGYVRAADGAITRFDAPGAGTAPGQGTLGENINTAGAIDGSYFDANGASHGFVRSKQGDITTFDPPGAGESSGQGTFVGANNPSGAIPGYYIDANLVFHGFLRTP